MMYNMRTSVILDDVLSFRELLLAAGALEGQRLEGSKQGLEERSRALQQQVNFIRLRYDGKRQQLQDDETAAALEAQEQRIRQFGQCGAQTVRLMNGRAYLKVNIQQRGNI